MLIGTKVLLASSRRTGRKRVSSSVVLESLKTWERIWKSCWDCKIDFLGIKVLSHTIKALRNDKRAFKGLFKSPWNKYKLGFEHHRKMWQKFYIFRCTQQNKNASKLMIIILCLRSFVVVFPLACEIAGKKVQWQQSEWIKSEKSLSSCHHKLQSFGTKIQKLFFFF